MNFNELKSEYEQQGFVVARGLFSREEVAELTAHYMDLHAEGGQYCEGEVNPESPDPLRRYPRMMNPHRGDERSMQFLLDERVRTWLTGLLGAEPYAVQTMMYFKPAGARGQALHQDQRYLLVQPGTCAAAWLALDRCDEENGCMKVVPGSQALPLLCPTKSDTSKSFTTETVPVPEGMEVVSVPMEPGDMLFFHGNLIHGSEPNRTTDRFRRIVVGHYIVAEAKTVARWYDPVLRMDGTTVADFDFTGAGGTCGRFVDNVIEMDSTVEEALAAH
jgi:hypothetical protein